MNIEDIFNCIPHRYPFLMVDRVLSYSVEERKLSAIKNVTVNEAFFVGHFPQRPVMPGVLIVEALAQASGVLATKLYPDANNGLFLLTGIDKTRFKRIVEPGDQLLLEVEITSDKHKLLKCQGKATVNGEIACTTNLTSMRKEFA